MTSVTVADPPTLTRSPSPGRGSLECSSESDMTVHWDQWDACGASLAARTVHCPHRVPVIVPQCLHSAWAYSQDTVATAQSWQCHHHVFGVVRTLFPTPDSSCTWDLEVLSSFNHAHCFKAETLQATELALKLRYSTSVNHLPVHYTPIIADTLGECCI